MNKSGKKRILLCWGYNRKGWIAPFEAIKSDFEFIYLFFKSKEEEDSCYTDCEKTYWNNYSSGFDIIDRIQPEAVILMSITSGYAISLNAACKVIGVPTFIFQHGLFRTFKEYRVIEKISKKTKYKRLPFNSNVVHTVPIKRRYRFLINSLSFKYKLFLPLILLYFWLLKIKGQYYASFYMPINIKKPFKYICYTPKNAKIYKELDKVEEESFIYIGIPELDPFFKDVVQVSEENYYLLIDQPFAENQYYNFGVSKTEMNECYAKLNLFCKAQKCKLVIKLHPESYKSTWLLRDENIDYIKDGNIINLIKKARGVFGTTSTLMLPAIYFKPCFLLLIHNSSFQKDVMDLHLAKGANFFNFKPEDISFNYTVSSDSKEEFEYNYLYKVDGKSVERLREILMQA